MNLKKCLNKKNKRTEVFLVSLTEANSINFDFPAAISVKLNLKVNEKFS